MPTSPKTSTSTARVPIPVNIVAGSLGVGKTSTINHLMAQRPADESWAILVNEYGLIGLDAALLEPPAPSGGPGVTIREVAGGCICCSAGFLFEMSLVLLLQRKPDRLLIEPTGLAAVSGILDTLDRPGIRESVDVRSVICLLDPTHLDDALSRETVQDQVASADVLLANRRDLASEAELTAFDAWADALFPPKARVAHVTHGRVPLAWLDLPRAARPEHAHSHHHVHGTDHDAHTHEAEAVACSAETPFVRRAHHSPVASTLGWVCWRELVFDAARAAAWLRSLSRLPGARRAKAVLRTTEGWHAFNIADGVESVSESGHRRDSRVEIIVEGAPLPDDLDALEAALRACVVETAPESEA